MIKQFKNDKVDCNYNTENFRPIVNELDDTICFGYTQQQVLDLCLTQPFPGSSTYEPNHPIWLGYSGNCKTPLDAWKDEKLLKQAIRNWFYMMCFNEIMIAFNPDNRTPEKINSLYIRYNEQWGKALINWNVLTICQQVVNRFTVAKIAPRVTAISSNKVLQFMEESKLDFSCGVYCPMGGFNGIPEGVEKWAKKHNKQVDIEVYDINPIFCKYFGYIQRDVTAQHIKTNKTVIVCSPFGDKDEKWVGTPEINAAGLNTYMGFHNWCAVITKYIEAPKYIFIGNTKESKNNTGLFSKSSGVAWYPEYIDGCYEIQEGLIH